jgi:sirohydrochlorin ferrochelatase
LALPRRTFRTRRAGRHRSPHRLTLPSDAPSLVLAVAGASCAASDQLAAEVAAAASLSCPGVDVRIGYLAGNVRRLEDALIFPASNAQDPAPAAVVVPLLAGPHPDLDAALARAIEQTSAPVMLGSHLGPHPLLASAVHARLAEAGLAREGRVTGLSIVASANGVLVLADRGEEAVQAAGVTAVLLAARLAVPTAAASLGDPGSINSALERLREAGVSHPAIAPCLIGPETPPHEIEIIRAGLNAPCAQPLGAHPAVAQLAAMRYGAALASLTTVALPSR